MPMPTVLRESAGRYVEAAKVETAPHLQRMLAAHAFALAQLAQKVECDKAANSAALSAAKCRNLTTPFARKGPEVCAA